MDPEINNQQHEEEQHAEEGQEQEDSDYTASDFDILKEYLESEYGENDFSTNAQMNDTVGYDFNFDGSMKVGENEVKHMEIKLVLDEIEGGDGITPSIVLLKKYGIFDEVEVDKSEKTENFTGLFFRGVKVVVWDIGACKFRFMNNVQGRT